MRGPMPKRFVSAALGLQTDRLPLYTKPRWRCIYLTYSISVPRFTQGPTNHKYPGIVHDLETPVAGVL